MTTYAMTFWEFRPIVETDARIAWKLVQALAHRLRGRRALTDLVLVQTLSPVPARRGRHRSRSPDRATVSPRTLFDDAAEDDATRRGSARPLQGLSKRGCGVDASSPVTTRSNVEASNRPHQARRTHRRRARHRAKRARRPEPTAAPVWGLVLKQHKLLRARKRRSSSSTAPRVGAPSAGRRARRRAASRSSQATSAGTGSASTSLEQAGAGVHGRRPPRRAGPLAPSSRAGDELTEASARCRQRFEPRRVEQDRPRPRRPPFPREGRASAHRAALRRRRERRPRATPAPGQPEAPRPSPPRRRRPELDRVRAA